MPKNTLSKKLKMKPVKIILVILATFFFACQTEEFKDLDGDDEIGSQPKPALSPFKVSLTNKQIANVKLVLGGTQMVYMSEEIKANGLVDLPPSNIASISSPVPGFVKQIDLVPGSKVTKGQVLCVLEHPDIITMQQDYLETESKLVFLKQELERQKELNREEVGALKKLQSAEADYAANWARLQGLAARLRLIGLEHKHFKNGEIKAQFSIKAPFTGYVKLVHINLGKFVSPNDVMMELINKDHIHLELKVFETEIGKIKIGQKIKFSLPSEPGKEYGAEVYLVGSTFEPETRAVNIHAHLHREQTDFLPGSYVNARIMAANHKVTALPEAAVIMDREKHFIFVQDTADKVHTHFSKLEVQAGITDKGFTEVTLPVKFAQSKKIVTSGAWYLQSTLANLGQEED